MRLLLLSRGSWVIFNHNNFFIWLVEALWHSRLLVQDIFSHSKLTESNFGLLCLVGRSRLAQRAYPHLGAKPKDPVAKWSAKKLSHSKLMTCRCSLKPWRSSHAPRQSLWSKVDNISCEAIVELYRDQRKSTGWQNWCSRGSRERKWEIVELDEILERLFGFSFWLAEAVWHHNGLFRQVDEVLGRVLFEKGTRLYRASRYIGRPTRGRLSR